MSPITAHRSPITAHRSQIGVQGGEQGILCIVRWPPEAVYASHYEYDAYPPVRPGEEGPLRGLAESLPEAGSRPQNHRPSSPIVAHRRQALRGGGYPMHGEPSSGGNVLREGDRLLTMCRTLLAPGPTQLVTWMVKWYDARSARWEE